MRKQRPPAAYVADVRAGGAEASPPSVAAAAAPAAAAAVAAAVHSSSHGYRGGDSCHQVGGWDSGTPPGRWLPWLLPYRCSPWPLAALPRDSLPAPAAGACPMRTLACGKCASGGDRGRASLSGACLLGLPGTQASSSKSAAGCSCSLKISPAARRPAAAVLTPQAWGWTLRACCWTLGCAS